MNALPACTLLLLLTPTQEQEQNTSLTRLATVENQTSLDRAIAILDPLLTQARAINRGAKVDQRLFATRCLAVAAALDRAQPADLSQLIAALEDEAQVVRRVARRALLRSSLPAKALIRKARKALLRDLRASAADPAVRAEIEGMRESLLAQLRPASPGRDATPGHKGRDEVIERTRHHANESAALATLKNLASAQRQAQASGVIDVDDNGRGEYGYFQELSGSGPVRGDETGTAASEVTIRPPVLSGAFGRVKSGVVLRSGYLFRVFLPGKSAVALPEAAKGGANGRAVSARQAERFWCAYAWPLAHGKSGRRAFFIDQSGDIYACSNVFRDYEGYARMPLPDAVRRLSGEKPATLADPAAKRTRARDGNVWSIVN